MSVIGKRVINIDELKLEHFEKGDKYACDAVRIGPLLGAKDLGYSYDVVPPGKRSCPFHSHYGEEEMFFIVKGAGTLRYGNETRKVRAGDFICCPTGGPDTAHQLVNDSREPLVSPKPQPSFAFRCSAACSAPESAHGRLVQMTTLCRPAGLRLYML